MTNGLKDDDLMPLIDVILKGSIIKSKSRQDCFIFTVMHNNKEYRVGVIGKQAYESIKNHGYKDQDDNIHLRVPASALKDNTTGWIATEY